MTQANVKGRSNGIGGGHLGTYDPNQIRNSIIYDVEFPDGEIRPYSANIIVDNMYSQVEAKGHSRSLMESIVDDKEDVNTLLMDNKHVLTRSGQRQMRKTTVGWKLLVQFWDGSKQWMSLKVLKETNPIEVPKFAVARGIDDQSVFHWWVPCTLCKCDRIISEINARVKCTSHNYGIEAPKTIDEARNLEKLNNDTYWEGAIQLEMTNMKVAFEILEDG